MFAQIVESPFVLAWNKPKLLPNLEGEILIRTPPAVEKCPGSQLLHDIQLSQLPITSFRAITGPIKVFDFDWSGRTKLVNNRCSDTPIKSLTDANAQAVFMWWDLQMDEDGEVLLSCAPYWAHPDFDELKKRAKREQNAIPWRDHWMQAIYFLPKPLQCRSGDNYRLIANHDEFSLWFDVQSTSLDAQPTTETRCDCAFHMTYSRTRIGQLNSSLRNKKFLKLMEEKITKTSSVLVLSEGSLLGLAAATYGAKRVYVLEKNRLSRNAMEMYQQHNNLNNVEFIEDLDALPADITHVFAEPHFNQSILPWDNFYFGTLLESCKQKLGANVEIFPNKGVIKAVAVHFLDLHKIQAIYKLKECHGFNMEIFDTLIEVRMFGRERRNF
jgi:type III protein arginine methyltransferase